MNGHIITIGGDQPAVTPENVRTLLDSSTRFWLDLPGTGGGGLELLRDTFGFHPLAIEDAEHFHQRPKIDGYDAFMLIVVYGATTEGLVEVHCFYTDKYLVTVHQGPCPDLEGLADRLRQRGPAPAIQAHAMLLYRVIDVLIDGYFPVLARFDDEIDELEDQILEMPTEEQLGQLFDMKRSLIALRRVVTPQRDMFAKLLSGVDTIPAMTPDAERYFRDLYDHLIRISDLVDSYRDLMTGALDTHLSTVSNRLNAVMKQLTIIATIFLPLSFLTGFFGQNFAWMIGRITSLPAFLVIGVGLQVAVVVGLLVLFRRRGWLSNVGTAPAARTRVPRDRRWRQLRLPTLSRATSEPVSSASPG